MPRGDRIPAVMPVSPSVVLARGRCWGDSVPVLGGTARLPPHDYGGPLCDQSPPCPPRVTFYGCAATSPVTLRSHVMLAGLSRARIGPRHVGGTGPPHGHHRGLPASRILPFGVSFCWFWGSFGVLDGEGEAEVNPGWGGLYPGRKREIRMEAQGEWGSVTASPPPVLRVASRGFGSAFEAVV